jgi:transcriptional regulator with XRE-family HTH domain
MAQATADRGLTLGLRLHLARRRWRLKLSEVAAATGVPVSTLSRYETDQTPPTSDRLLALALLYKTTPNELLGYSAEGLTPPQLSGIEQAA